MAISGGRPEVLFPAHARLVRYLDSGSAAADRYADAVAAAGVDLRRYAEHKRPTLPLASVLAALDDLVPALVDLA